MYMLDHIVHFVNKPEKLVDQMNEIGVHTVLGGKHEMWGTYNSLSYFHNLSYIEFIGIFDESLFRASAKEPFTLHETYEKRNRKNGLNRIALRTNRIEEDAKRLKAAGYSVFGPDTFSRKRPDGSIVSWKLLHFGVVGQEFDFPFLIEWQKDDQTRFDELTYSGTLSEHKLGNLTIKEIIFNVSNLGLANQWAQLFDFNIESTNSNLKIMSPNCNFNFVLDTDGQNNIKEVVISGASDEIIIEIENAHYKFIP